MQRWVAVQQDATFMGCELKFVFGKVTIVCGDWWPFAFATGSLQFVSLQLPAAPFASSSSVLKLAKLLKSSQTPNERQL